MAIRGDQAEWSCRGGRASASLPEPPAGRVERVTGPSDAGRLAVSRSGTNRSTIPYG